MVVIACRMTQRNIHKFVWQLGRFERERERVEERNLRNKEKPTTHHLE